MSRIRSQKLGHQAPKGYRINKFASIEIEGDFAYCASHDFLYNSEEEYEKLHNGEACYYTDKRFYDGRWNFFKECKIFWQRWHPISTKSCIRRTLSCKNIPVGTIVRFESGYYVPGKDVDLAYQFKIKKENKLDLEYEISIPGYSKNFNTCQFSKELTDALRENGFLVHVNNKNPDFLMGMVKSAASLTGQSIDVDDDDGGEIATAYGHGKRIGFSSGKNSYRGYSNGCDNILWDRFGEFDKWSRCYEISKDATIDEIIKILKEK